VQPDRIVAPVPTPPAVVVAAKSEPKVLTSAAYDGDWQIDLTGGEFCQVKTSRWKVAIRNGVFDRSEPEPGRVLGDGSFSFTLPARANPNVIVVYRGQFTGVSGKGTYVVGKCNGAIVLTKL
jgi:hypothetical protein